VWRAGGAAPWPVALPILDAAAVVAAVAARPVTHEHVPAFSDALPSAVMVAIADGPAGAEVLLTRRAMHLRSHRGEVSFPGGRVDPGESFEQAALREAHEEVGLSIESVEVVGHLDALSTVVSRSFIVPVVGIVREPPPLQASAHEVERVMWVPLAELTRPDTYREEWWGTPPLDRPMFFFELDDETIWGATARMLHQLLRVAHGIEVPEPPAW
jgi:8-oxo-dGTP pyrophosphatase MutT (NUDIX family)